MFHALLAPTQAELDDVAVRTALRVEKVLARHGRSLDGARTREPDAPTTEQLALFALCEAAAAGHGLLGDRAGKPLLRIVDPTRARTGERVAESQGINVHAEVAVPAHDRARLERLCRYLCRPPIAQDRLEEMEGGKLSYLLKKPWRDGTTALVLEPLNLIARVCALIPPPRFHMVRYHGVLSSHAKVRAKVVPKRNDAHTLQPLQLKLFERETDATVVAPEPRRRPWASLLRHVFQIDVRTCVRCGGVTRWLEAATTPEAVRRLLAKHGLAARPPPAPRAVQGQLRLAFSNA